MPNGIGPNPVSEVGFGFEQLPMIQNRLRHSTMTPIIGQPPLGFLGHKNVNASVAKSTPMEGPRQVPASL